MKLRHFPGLCIEDLSKQFSNRSWIKPRKFLSYFENIQESGRRLSESVVACTWYRSERKKNFNFLITYRECSLKSCSFFNIIIFSFRSLCSLILENSDTICARMFWICGVTVKNVVFDTQPHRIYPWRNERNNSSQ